MEANDVILIDVLKPESFEKGHIPGAINIPLKKVASEAKKRFDKDQEIIVYCSDEECSASPAAGKKLEDIGFSNVTHFKGGKKEWQEAGYQMES